MKAKEYLMQVSKADRMIQNKIQEIDRWKSIALSTSVSANENRVQSSGSQQKMADAIGRYVDIQNEINDQIDRLVDKRQEIISNIELLPEAEYDILYMVYIQGIELNELAEIRGKSYTWATTTHGRALSHLQKIIDGKEKASLGC